MDLRPGIEIIRARGPPAKVVSVEDTGEGLPTFNLEVADYHTYFVGNSQVWVHNNNCNLASPERTKHILDGDHTGGGHRPGAGVPGKTEFPAGWSDDKIMNDISDVATDPSATRTVSSNGRREVVEGTRDGVDIRVVVEDGRKIITGHPTNLPRNPPKP